MTVLARRAQRQAQQRGFPISQGGWGSFMGDPAAIPPPSAMSMGVAGVVVNERTVLSLMAVSTCIRINGDAVSGLEPHVYRQKGRRPSPEDKEVDPPAVIAEPYADMTRRDGDFRRVASLGLGGNTFTHIVDRDARGNPCQAEVMNPSVIRVKMIEGRKTYLLGASDREIPAQDIIHTPWMSLAGGLVGLNPIELGVNGFGIPIAAEQYAGRYFAQGMHPTGILSLEKPLRPEDSKRIKDELYTKHGGLSQAHTPIVLDSAAKWQQISITPETAQLLETRAFSRGEIGGFYGVPSFLVGDTTDKGGPWGKGLQEESMGFAIYTLSGYTGRLDDADTALLAPGYYVRRDLKELWKTNDAMRGTFVSMLRAAAVISPETGAKMVGAPVPDEPGSDSIFAPMNSAHSDFLAAGDKGAESGLPESKNPKGVPDGTSQGGEPTTEPEGGQK
jgi:HK97 family phage portal protein